MRPWAHPRVCGENTIMSAACHVGWGSSPRVRGKRVMVTEKAGAVGLIPACAGKTPWPPPGLSWPRAHPRVCGENFGEG